MERFFVNQRNNNCVIIGGVRSLSDFSAGQIAVTVAGAVITVTGDKLSIERFDENEIIIHGNITDVVTTQTKRTVTT